MAPKIKVDSYDYQLAIEKINELIINETNIYNLSPTEIVDLVIDTILN